MTVTTEEDRIRKTGWHRIGFLLQALLCPLIFWGMSSSALLHSTEYHHQTRQATQWWKKKRSTAPVNSHCHQHKFTVQSIVVFCCKDAITKARVSFAKLCKPALSNKSWDKQSPWNSTRTAVYIVKLVSRFLLTPPSFTTVSFCQFPFFICKD